MHDDWRRRLYPRGVLFSDLVLPLLSAVGALVVVAVAGYLTRRSVEPTAAEVEAAQRLAVRAWHANPAGADPIATPAEDRALEILVGYAQDLRAESSRIAKRSGADHPSVVHVQLAGDRIGLVRRRGSALADIGLAVGSVLVGGGLGFGVNLVTGGHAESGAISWAVVCGAAGLVVFATSATLKWVWR